MEPALFKQRVAHTSERVRASRRRPGVQEILVPGDRSARHAERNRRMGVPLSEVTVRELDGLNERFGLGRRLRDAERPTIASPA